MYVCMYVGEETSGENPYARVLDLVSTKDDGKSVDVSRYRGLLISLRYVGR